MSLKIFGACWLAVAAVGQVPLAHALPQIASESSVSASVGAPSGDGSIREQVQQLELQEAREKEELKKRVQLFHRMRNAPLTVRFAWEAESAGAVGRERMLKLLEMEIKSRMDQVQSLALQRETLLAELEWMRAKDVLPATTAAALPVTKAQKKRLARFSCEVAPVDSAGGASIQLQQDFGEHVDRETGLKWPSSGWWLSQIGPEVRACSAGTVAFNGRIPGRGRVVLVDHGPGLVTLYANLQDVAPGDEDVRVGASVVAGQRLGIPKEKFYFEFRRTGEAVHPKLVLPKAFAQTIRM